MENKTGEAYGFFYYKGKTKDIKTELPSVRDYASVPADLSLYLVDGVENLDTKGDSGLAEVVQKAKSSHMSHVIKATLPNSGNIKVADNLADVLNGLYTSPLYEKNEPFNSGIVYKHGDKYVFKGD